MTRFVASLLGALTISVIFCVQQLARSLGAPRELVFPKNPPPPGPDRSRHETFADEIYGWTRRVLRRCGDPAIVFFLALEECQAKVLGLLSDLLTGRVKRWSHLPKQLLQQAQLAARAVGRDRSLAIQQAKNTRYIFVLVRNNPEILGIPGQGDFDLLRYVERAYAVGEFEGIWTIEGLGHVYTQRVWSHNWGASVEARGILSEGQAAGLPDESLTMMHAGLGLGFAESMLKQLAPDSGSEEVERVVAAFLRLCHNNSRPGYVGCSLESLGLVTRCFNYHLMDLVERALVGLNPIAWEYFWRGAGRGMYFAPAHLVQPIYSPWVAAAQEAPTPQVLEILKSAITWPANIVNMRTPEIFERFILRYGVLTENENSIIQGVAASTTMAVDINPRSSVVARYLEHQPTLKDPRIVDLWNRLVRRPVDDAVHRYQPTLRRHRAMDQVFRLQPLETLVRDLERA